MTQCVRRNVLVSNPGSGHRRSEALTHRADGFAVPLDHGVLSLTKPVPAPEVRQKPIAQSDRRLPLFRLPGPLSAPVEHALLKIDVAAAYRGLKCRAANCSMSGA